MLEDYLKLKSFMYSFWTQQEVLQNEQFSDKKTFNEIQGERIAILHHET